MKALNIKLLRDLSSMKGQSVSIAAVMGCGIAVFVMSMATLATLTRAKDRYYAKNRFAEVFVSVVRAPRHLTRRVAAIDGVAVADDRVVEAVTLNLAGMAEPASGRVISLPERQGGGLNLVHLLSGRLPESGRTGEVLVSEPFALAHDLHPGEKLAATLRGRRQLFTVAGVALSPEFVMEVPPGSLFPDDKRFGVFWMNRRSLAAASDMTGAFNDLSLTLAKDANPAEVIRKLDRLLEPYGGSGAITRENHQSARYIADELQGLRAIGLVPPLVFLGVAAFLLNISLRRILSLQREQVAALKAFGYTDAEVGGHYAKLVAVIVLAGTAVGCGSGYWMGVGMVSMYRGFYRFPAYDYAPGLGTYLAAAALALAAGALGVFGGVRATMRLPPAEAMRPEPPASYQPSLFERLGAGYFLSQPARMVVREIGRRPVKAMLTSLGIAFSCAILIVGDFGKDSFEHLIDFQFGTAERDDARVQFVESRPARAIQELAHVGGVMRAEPFRSVAVRLRHGPRSKQLAITGIATGNSLYRLLDRNRQVIPVRGGGLLLSTILAETLDVGVGDSVRVEVLEGGRPVGTLQVSGLVEDFAGTAAYMHLETLNRMLGEGRTISGAYLQLDPLHQDSAFSEMKGLPGVAGVALKKATIESFMETVADSMLKMRGFNLFFATVIAIGVVYSSARISFSEKGRDLATLRVIGLTRGEVSGILLGELAVLTVAAIPVGLLIGYGLCLLMSQAMSTEMYRIPFIIHPATYGFASLVVLGASTASGLVVRRKIDRLEIVTALKVRE